MVLPRGGRWFLPYDHYHSTCLRGDGYYTLLRQRAYALPERLRSEDTCASPLSFSLPTSLPSLYIYLLI